MRQFLDFFYVACIFFIFGSFFFLLGHDSSGGSYWSLPWVHKRLLIWLAMSGAIGLFIFLLEFFLRRKFSRTITNLDTDVETMEQPHGKPKSIGKRNGRKGIHLRLPRDVRTRINIYFMTPFVLVALIFLGLNLYKNVRYSNFTLVVKGRPQLEYSSLGRVNNSTVISPASSNSQGEEFAHLHTFWWANRSMGYSLGDTVDNRVWFHVSPTIKGRFILTSAADSVSNPGIQISNEQGYYVQSLIPNRWYAIEQYGKWYTVKLQWG